MILRRHSVKLCGAGEAEVALTEIVPVFHEWIRSGDFEELLIDVGDYKHVAGGPGIVLVGLESDYSVSSAGGGLGLVYTCKRLDGQGASESLAASIGRLAYAAARLSDEPALRGRIRFDPRRIEVTFLDRLTAANSEEGFQFVVPLMNRALGDVLQVGPVNLVSTEADQRRPLRVLAATDSDLDFDRVIQFAGIDRREEVST
ncbi:MAG TPA: hypothetical protein VMO47_06815 [Rhodothermales bacterium]|nr:hypothetical protein [Rhodothermales bacterium]